VNLTLFVYRKIVPGRILCFGIFEPSGNEEFMRALLRKSVGRIVGLKTRSTNLFLSFLKISALIVCSTGEFSTVVDY